jgi:hypothetical protein
MVGAATRTASYTVQMLLLLRSVQPRCVQDLQVPARLVFLLSSAVREVCVVWLRGWAVFNAVLQKSAVLLLNTHLQQRHETAMKI